MGTCPRCGKETVELGNGFAMGCSDPTCIAWIKDDPYQTPAQEDEAIRVNDGQVHEVIGKTVICDPELEVVSFWKWILNKIRS